MKTKYSGQNLNCFHFGNTATVPYDSLVFDKSVCHMEWNAGMSAGITEHPSLERTSKDHLVQEKEPR